MTIENKLLGHAAGWVTKDPVNDVVIDVVDEIGVQRLGIMQNEAWHHDPKHLLFTMSRYKFVAKMLSGKDNVAEIGCGDAFFSRIVLQEVGRLTAIDYDPLFIKDALERNTERWAVTAMTHDILQGPVPNGPYDAVYSMDVLEHIEPKYEAIFLENLKRTIVTGGVAIVGMPSLEAQVYACEASKAGHINCKSGADFKALMQKHFEQVFLFSMNDEVVHTGYVKMAHYLIALCCVPIIKSK